MTEEEEGRMHERPLWCAQRGSTQLLCSCPSRRCLLACQDVHRDFLRPASTHGMRSQRIAQLYPLRSRVADVFSCRCARLRHVLHRSRRHASWLWGKQTRAPVSRGGAVDSHIRSSFPTSSPHPSLCCSLHWCCLSCAVPPLFRAFSRARVDTKEERPTLRSAKQPACEGENGAAP